MKKNHGELNRDELKRILDDLQLEKIIEALQRIQELCMLNEECNNNCPCYARGGCGLKDSPIEWEVCFKPKVINSKIKVVE